MTGVGTKPCYVAGDNKEASHLQGLEVGKGKQALRTENPQTLCG